MEAEVEALGDNEQYPYCSEVQINGHRVFVSDMVVRFEDPNSNKVTAFERVYGYTWGGVITHVIDGIIPAEFYAWDSFADKLESGKITILKRGCEYSYYIDDRTVRSLSYYSMVYEGGLQPILVSERREAREKSAFQQSVTIYDSKEEFITDLYDPENLSSHEEAKEIYDFLLGTDVGKKDIRQPDELPTSNQSDINSFE